MSELLKRWEIAPRAPESHFAQFPDLPPLVTQILFNRGFTSSREVTDFLAHRWSDDDPLALKGMAVAVERLVRAIEGQQSIAVYGDYDADGVTDIAVYRSTTGEWFIGRSSDAGLIYHRWGWPAGGGATSRSARSP